MIQIDRRSQIGLLRSSENSSMKHATFSALTMTVSLFLYFVNRNNQVNFLCRRNRPDNIPNILLSVTEYFTIIYISKLERNTEIDFWGHCLLWAVNHSPYYPDSSRLIGNKTGQRASTGWKKMMYFIVQFYDQIDHKIRRMVVWLMLRYYIFNKCIFSDWQSLIESRVYYTPDFPFRAYQPKF